MSAAALSVHVVLASVLDGLRERCMPILGELGDEMIQRARVLVPLDDPLGRQSLG